MFSRRTRIELADAGYDNNDFAEAFEGNDQQRHIGRLFARRAATVEPFHGWLKLLFDLHKRAWPRGLDNNRTQLLDTIGCYQLLLHFNRRHHRPNGQIQWILEIL